MKSAAALWYNGAMETSSTMQAMPAEIGAALDALAVSLELRKYPNPDHWRQKAYRNAAEGMCAAGGMTLDLLKKCRVDRYL